MVMDIIYCKSTRGANLTETLGMLLVVAVSVSALLTFGRRLFGPTEAPEGRLGPGPRLDPGSAFRARRGASATSGNCYQVHHGHKDGGGG